MVKRKRTTPENIQRLEPNEIFCFGSNLRGVHGKGAALQAYRDFGAEYGVGEGLTGQCYALPTLGRNLEQLTGICLASVISKFNATVREHPELQFLLTKVGCGLAGYDEEYMKSFFTESPSNVIKPEGW